MKLYLFLGFLLVAHAWAAPQQDMDDVDEEREEEDGGMPDEEYEEENQVQGGYDDDESSEDPCFNHPCPIGRECEVENGAAYCTCAHACPKEPEARAKVCSTTNVTFDSECELHRQKCLCQKQQSGCEDQEYQSIHMNYYGPCKELGECNAESMEAFPERMRNWLYHIMEQLAERKELPQPAMKMAKKARKQPKKWVLPTIWKFCDLDHSHDLYVDAEELLSITAPLKPMEPCTGPFIEKCDADNNGFIGLEEWGECLGLDAEEVKEGEECNKLHKRFPGKQ